MNRTIGVSISLALIPLAFLGFVACTSGPSNSNQAFNAADAAKNSSTAAPPAGPCDGGDIPARIAALKALLEDPNTDTGDGDLNYQRQNTFEIKIDADGSAGILMRVRGKISKHDNPPKLRKLMMFIDKHMKKGCVSRVKFESMAAASDGFEWGLCDSGYCPTPPDGRCESCSIPSDSPTPKPSPTPTPSPTP